MNEFNEATFIVHHSLNSLRPVFLSFSGIVLLPSWETLNVGYLLLDSGEASPRMMVFYCVIFYPDMLLLHWQCKSLSRFFPDNIAFWTKISRYFLWYVHNSIDFRLLEKMKYILWGFFFDKVSVFTCFGSLSVKLLKKQHSPKNSQIQGLDWQWIKKTPMPKEIFERHL